MSLYHLAAQADVGTSMERPRLRRRGERRRHGQRARGSAGRGRTSRLLLDRRRDLRRGASVPRAEDAERRPVSAYGIAKLAAEKYLAGWNRIHGSGHVVAALRERLRAAPVGRARGRRRLDLHGAARARRGDTRLRRRRAVARLRLRRRRRRSGARGDRTPRAASSTSAPGVETTVNELHRLCAQTVGVEAETRHVAARPGDARRSVLDVTRAERELGWRAQTPLAEGLRLTWG